jgi:hypothetical protein
MINELPINTVPINTGSGTTSPYEVPPSTYTDTYLWFTAEDESGT